ncbi:MAG: hypothetical protein ACLQUY_15070 [Ktedonobacterales bacterium]
MATTTKKQIQSTEESEVEQAPVVLNNTTDLEHLRQQARAIAAQIKEAKAASRGNEQQERLAKEIETQEMFPNRS